MGYRRSRRLIRLLLLRLPHDEVQRKRNHTQWLEPESVQQCVLLSTHEGIRMHTCSATPIKWDNSHLFSLLSSFYDYLS